MEFAAWIIIGAGALFGLVSLGLAGIYMQQIHETLRHISRYEEQICATFSAFEKLAAEHQREFANAVQTGIGALRVLTTQIEYQAKVNEIYHRKREAQRFEAASENGDAPYEHQQTWNREYNTPLAEMP